MGSYKQSQYLSIDRSNAFSEDDFVTSNDSMLEVYLMLNDRVNVIWLKSRSYGLLWSVVELMAFMGGLGDCLFLLGILLTNFATSSLF